MKPQVLFPAPIKKSSLVYTYCPRAGEVGTGGFVGLPVQLTYLKNSEPWLPAEDPVSKTQMQTGSGGARL